MCSVLVACLVAQEETWLPRFLDRLSRLSYPKLRYAFVVGKRISMLHQWANQRWSEDKTKTWIKESDPQELTDRFERLAYLRNVIVEKANIVEDYVFWIDCDVIEFQPDLIQELMRHNVSVVAPSVYIEATNQFYDTFAFRYLNETKFQAFGSHPPAGLLEVHSVGTCYLVHSSLYNQSRVRYHGGDSEQVTFCTEARNVGGRVYVDFSLRIEHANLPNYGVAWH